MYEFVKKIGQINVRVKPDLKADLETLAEYHGLTVSSYVHSVLVREVRRERLSDAQIFVQPKIDSVSLVQLKDIGEMTAEARPRKSRKTG